MSYAGSLNLLTPVRHRERPRLLTAIYFAMCMVVLVGAVASRNNLLYWFVAMAIGGLLAHGFTAGPPMMGVRFARIDLPDSIERSRETRIRVTLASSNRWRAARALRVRVTFTNSHGRSLVAEGGLLALGPGEQGSVDAWISNPPRGVYDLESVRVVTTFPFGLSRKEIIFKTEGRLICVPNAAALSPADRRKIERRATQLFADSQPAELREYHRGDARRLIAWKASARAQRMMVRDLESETGRRLWIRCLVESGALQAREPHAEKLLDHAAAVATLAAARGLEVGILHEPSGTRVLDASGSRWRLALAELGDREGLAAGPPPAPGDAIIEIGPDAADAAEASRG